MSSQSPQQSHTIIISIATSNPNKPTLAGVEWDFPLVLDELAARTAGTFQVITDLQLPKPITTAQMLLPSVRNVEDSIKKVAGAMKPRDLCYVYVAGDTYQDGPRTAYMPLASGEDLDGKDLMSWITAAGRDGRTFVVIADVGMAASLIRLPFVADVSDRSLSWICSSENRSQNENGGVLAILATDHGQPAVTIDNGSKGPYPGYHGLFTWALFNFLRNQPLEVDLVKLLLHLRKHSAWHPTKPLPQVSATTEGFSQAPVGRRTA